MNLSGCVRLLLMRTQAQASSPIGLISLPCVRWTHELKPRRVGVTPREELTEERVAHIGVVDKYRNAHLAIVVGKHKRFIIQPSNVKVGDILITSRQSGRVHPRLLRPGNRFMIGSMPPGTVVHDLEWRPGRGGQLIRSNGCGAHIIDHDNEEKLVTLLMQSGKTTKLSFNCMATVGKVADRGLRPKGKAGKPAVRGRKWPK